MHWIVTFYLFLGLVNPKNIQNNLRDVTQKIIGGAPVDIKLRPFMLSLHDSHNFRCGATIISTTWGITALHCLVSASHEKYFVRAGSNYFDRGGTVHRIRRIHIYNDTRFPYWFTDILCHDIALFEVSPAFQYSRTIQPARLPSVRNRFRAPHRLHVSGWGFTTLKITRRPSKTLMGVHVNYVSFGECINSTPEYKLLVNKDHHLCYGGVGKDSCYGDSGGPLASSHTVYGIVSFGISCAEVPGIYAKISYYRQWIKRVTNL